MFNKTSVTYYFFKFVYTLFLAAVIGGGYFYRHKISSFLEGTPHKTEQVAGQESKPLHGNKPEQGNKQDEQSREIKYWVSPMEPTYIRNEPGKDTMGMDLKPVYKDEEEEIEPGVVKIDPIVVQNIGVRTAKVQTRIISKNIRTIGRVVYDERKVVHVQSKTSGWVEKLYVDFTGQEVKKGDFLLDIYSPELVATEEEYLLALAYKKNMAKSPISEVAAGGERLLEASRRRLELFDVPEHQIKELEETRKIKKTLHIHSPADGVVVKKNVIVGMRIKPGMTLYEVADLSRIWVLADIYEYEVPWVKLNQKVSMTLASFPGKTFRGKVTFIYPYLEKKTRTIQVRMEFDNPNLALKPEMYANLNIVSGIKKKGITIPSEAVIRSGSRNIVLLDKGDGRFEVSEVTLGLEAEGYYEILKGLKKGETVVTSANFLLDSESNLQEAIQKMLTPKKMKPPEKAHSKMDNSK